jgi:L-asparaginase
MTRTLKKLCLIYTGGTIGMEETQDESGEWVREPPKDPSSFFRIAPEIRELAQIDFLQLLNKDSTDMTPLDWTLMAKEIYRRRKDYHGFVIAHGTDTMHFSASALAFAFGPNLNFPIVFTGAQTTPHVPHGDARINLVRAVRVATEDLYEVAICFGDFVFRGCRAQKKDEKKFDAFESPAFFPIADITEQILFHNRAKRKGGPFEPTGEIDFRPEFELGLIQISLIPGLLPDQFMPIIEADKLKGIILQSFGAGNVPSEGEFSFGNLISVAKQKNIPVIITSQFPANSTLHSMYRPGMRARERGAIPTGNMTNAAASAKFRWVLARVNAEISAGTLGIEQKLNRISDDMTQVYVDEMDDTTNPQRALILRPRSH